MKMKPIFNIGLGRARTLSCVFLALLASQKALGEENAYYPVVQEGRVWCCFWSGHEWNWGDAFDRIYTITGDTLIGGKEYKKVFCQDKEYFADDKQHYHCAIREEDRVVYCIDQNKTDERLHCDFRNPEESLEIETEGITVKRGGGIHPPYGCPTSQCWYPLEWKTNDGYWQNGVDWFDGVGIINGDPFEDYLAKGDINIHDNLEVRLCMQGYDVYELLLSAHNDATFDEAYFKNLDRIVFDQDWMQDVITPNAITSMQSDSKTGNRCYDLQGRRFAGSIRKGVYVRKGKKVAKPAIARE